MAVLEAISSSLGEFVPVVDLVCGPFGWPAGRAETHWRVLLGKEPKPKPRGFSTPGTPVINQQGAADLVAFGLSRHRAWVVGQRPLGCSLGCSLECCGWPLGGLLEAVLRPLGCLFWGSWGPLGALLGPPGGLLRRKAGFFSVWCRAGAPLGLVLGASWVVLGGSWAVLGPSWRPLGPSWDGLRGSLGHLGASLGLFGASWGRFEAPWGSFEVLLRAPGVSCGLSGASRGGSEATILVRGVKKSPSGGPRGKPRKRPGAPRSAREFGGLGP